METFLVLEVVIFRRHRFADDRVFIEEQKEIAGLDTIRWRIAKKVIFW